MKAILEFTLPEEREEFITAQKGVDYKIALDEMWSKVFRPAFKHGYSDEELNKLLENEDCFKVLEKLAELYREVLDENEVDL